MSNLLLRRALPSLPFVFLSVACGNGSTVGAGGAGGGSGGASTASSGATTTTASGTGTASSAASSGTGTSSASGTGGGPSACTPGTTKACYSGPPTTLDIGACKGGTATCGADGTFGACTGEVLPVPESCATLLDDNCNGATNEGCACIPGASMTCYTGAPGTQDVGICKGGVATCAADGLSLGPCTGQVTPKTEDCLSPADEDCNGTADTCTGNGVWAKRFGDAGAQSGAAVAVHVGGAVITGSFAGTTDFGGGLLTSAGATDAFLASYDYMGAHLWSRRFGDAVAQAGVGVAVDKLGNIVVIGDFAGTIDLCGGALTSAGLTDVFVAKFDSGGNHLWSKRFGDAKAQNGHGIAVDDAGDVVITGSFAGKIDLGGGAITAAGATDVFVAKLDPSGAYLWGKTFGGAQGDSGKAVAVDPAGNVVLTGEMGSAVDFGGGALPFGGATDVFLASFTAAGNYVWAKSFGNTAAQTAGGVAVDAAGSVVLTGDVAGAANFGGGLLTSAGSTDVFVARFTVGGMHLWSKLFGTAGAENGNGVAVDSFGGIVLTGDFATSVNFGGGALTSAGGTDVFAVKLDPQAGAHVWSKRYGDNVAQSGAGIAADDTGALLVGTFAGTINFGTGAMTSAGTTDVFLAKLLP